MIEIHRLSGKKVLLNAELIVSIESTPDTLVTLANGEKWIVAETDSELKERILEYKRKIGSA